MHSISVSSSAALGAKAIEETSQAGPINPVSRCERVESLTTRRTFDTTTKETNHLCYDGFFGLVNIKSKSTFLSRSRVHRLVDKRVLQDKTIRITPLFLRKTLELRFMHSFGHISRTLRIYPILEYGAPIFEFCRRGDLQSLQIALTSGTISPFITDPHGWSLLHVSLLPS